MNNCADVLIVGAGFSGLAAAKKLRDGGKSVLVLEARDRPGGRVKPGKVAGHPIDLGGMWIGGSHARLLALVEAHGLKTWPTYLDGECVIEMLGRTVRCPREDFAGALPLSAKLEFALLEGRLKRMIDSIPLDDPIGAPQADKWDAMSLGEWMRKNVRTKGLRQVLTLITRSLFCAEPDELSLFHWLFYVKSGGGLDALVSAEPGGAQFLMVEGGLSGLASRMATAMDDSIRYEAAVNAISQNSGAVEITTAAGILQASHCIVALAPTLCSRIDWPPPLPHARDALHQRMPIGSVIKCWIAYDRPFWREKGLNAFVSSDACGFGPCFDVSPPDGPGLIAGFFDAAEASRWSARTRDERITEILALLTRTLGPEAASPLDYVENDWTTEAWSRGCYAAFATPGVWTRFGTALRAPVGRIHWAGTETATEHNGYVEGALQAGERAANEVIARSA